MLSRSPRNARADSVTVCAVPVTLRRVVRAAACDKARWHRFHDCTELLDGVVRRRCGRMLATQQQIEQHAERVDVGRGRHVRALDLLGRRVFRCEGASGELRELGRLRTLRRSSSSLAMPKSSSFTLPVAR